jgi:hypothetical protein
VAHLGYEFGFQWLWKQKPELMSIQYSYLRHFRTTCQAEIYCRVKCLMAGAFVIPFPPAATCSFHHSHHFLTTEYSNVYFRKQPLGTFHFDLTNVQTSALCSVIGQCPQELPPPSTHHVSAVTLISRAFGFPSPNCFTIDLMLLKPPEVAYLG